MAEATGPVCFRGGATRAHWQPSLPTDGVVIETTGLAGDGALRPDNLSGSFPAGTRMKDVQAQLRAAGLWLPVEHCDAPAATLGGCLAAGFTDPLRLGYGAPRDWVLGLQVATKNGLLNLGGEVIKNVAGYDLVKMHLGAWGRFGLITRATLRLLPLPEADCTVTATFTGPDAAPALDAAVRAVLASGTRPAALELVGQPGNLRLIARVVGDADGVRARAAKLAASLGAPAEIGGAELWTEYCDQRAALASRYPWRLKLSLRAPGVNTALRLLKSALDGLDWAVAGHAGSGVFTACWANSAGPAASLNRLRDLAAAGEEPWGLAAEGGAALAMTGAPAWVSFPPRPPRSQDKLEIALRNELAPGHYANPHLPSPREA